MGKRYDIKRPWGRLPVGVTRARFELTVGELRQIMADLEPPHNSCDPKCDGCRAWFLIEGALREMGYPWEVTR